jgi:hypothetical protein
MTAATAVPQPDTGLQLLQLITGRWISTAISVAAGLDIAGHLAGGAQSAAYLAAAA